MQISHADGTQHPHDTTGKPIIKPPPSMQPKAEEQWMGATDHNQSAVSSNVQPFPLAGVVVGILIVLVFVIIVSLYMTRRQSGSSK